MNIISDNNLNIIIKKLFPNLNINDFNIISNIFPEILNSIFFKFFYDNDNDNKLIYLNQLYQNDNRDIISLLLLIFPYIDKSNDYKIFKKIKYLKELILDKTSNNEYKNTKYQYDLIFKDKNNYTEVSDMEMILENNKELLLHTIYKTYYKLAINWTNIFPISLENFRDSNLFKNTFYLDYTQQQFILNNSVFNDNLQNIYNQYDYYKIQYSGIIIDDIYDIFVNFYFKSSIDIEFLIPYSNNNFIDLKELDIYVKNLLDNLNKRYNWDSLTEEFKNNFKKRIYSNDYINNLKIIKRYFKKYYDEYYNIKDFKNLENHIYNFLLISYHKLKLSPYYFYFNDEDYFPLQEQINEPGFFDGGLLFKYPYNINEINNVIINPYDYFLFGKELYTIFDSDNYDNLNSDKKDIFINQILDFNYNYNKSNLISIKFTYLIVKSFEIVFKTLSRLGLLSEFKYNPETTDMINYINGSDLDIQVNKLKKNLKNQINKYSFENKEVKKSNDNYIDFKSYYNNCYYFVNNDKFGDLKLSEYKNNPITSHMDYFDILQEKNMKWFTTHTFNWITQIDFFNKFMNKRVLLITGGTGQGKSTFFPMLVFYCSKILDLNLRSKIIITQPRINPVNGNSDYISKQLFVPVSEKIDNYEEDVDTLNTKIQFTHSLKKHVSKLENYFLRLATDGSLITELSDNILLKKKFITDKKLNKFKYLNENIYDTIGIDESHEHNSRMDLILTIMKYSLLYNTSPRLLIISATLDTDEASYRKYYKFIDDNFKYPFNYTTIDYFINKNLLDRRIHIAPPGNETRFKIDEYYEKKNPSNIEEATDLGIFRVTQILNNSDNGEILFFTYSTAEVIKICNKINERTNNNVVAIPFFSKMNSKYKNYIQNLDKHKNNINFRKDLIVDIYSNLLSAEDQTTKSKYDRLIIVATNVAEASITIHNLKFVVDLGYQLTPKYDINNNLVNYNRVVSITESSRLQRKGRVGRKESGTVYYIYEKFSKENIKAEFNICNEDLSDTLHILINDNYKQFKLFQNINYYKNYYDLIDNIEIIDKYNYLPEFNIFKKQFMNENELLVYERIIPDDFFMFKYFKFTKIIFKTLLNDLNDFDFYPDGFHKKNILDNYGKFYLIHPNEEFIERNQNSMNIIKYNNIKIDNLEDKHNKIKKYYQLYLYQNIFLDLDSNINEIKYAKVKNTKLIYKISSYFQDLSFKFNSLILYGILYDCVEDILFIISALKNNEKFNNIFTNIEYKNIYIDNRGDIFVYLKLFEFFNNSFPKFNKVEQKININNLNDQFNYFIDILENNTKNKLDHKLYNNYINNLNKLILNRNEKLNFTNNLFISDSFDIIYASDSFDNWCEINFINKEKFSIIIKDYLNLKQKYIEMKFDEEQKVYNLFDSLESIYYNKDLNHVNNIIKCFIMAYSDNLVNYTGEGYIDLIKSNNNIFYNLPVKNKIESVTIHSEYMLYLNNIIKNDKNYISHLIKIKDVKIIFELLFNIYNLKKYVTKNNNLINYYNLKYLNNALIFIKKNEKIKLENHNLNRSLLKEIEFLDNKNNLENYRLSTYDLNDYQNRYEYLSVIDFYYYFTKNLIKN